MSNATAQDRRFQSVLREARAWKDVAERNKEAAEHVDRERVRLAGIAINLDAQLTAARAELAELPELRAALAAARDDLLALQLRSLESLLTFAHTLRELRDELTARDHTVASELQEAREAEQRAREAGRAAEDQLSAHIIKSNKTLAAFATADRICEERTASLVHAAREVAAAYLAPGLHPERHANLQQMLRADWRTLSKALQQLTKAASELPVVMYGADSCA